MRYFLLAILLPIAPTFLYFFTVILFRRKGETKNYNCTNVYKDETTEINVLSKKSFLHRNHVLIAYILFLIMTIYKIHIGDFSID